MNVHLPKGKTVELPAVGDSKTSLADWLAACGYPLNTRCGGRGLCRGCQMEWLRAGQAPILVKACQTAAAVVTDSIRIPPESLADQSLSGVSAFDLRLPHDARRLGTFGLGLALDIGTTTLAAALWDLPSDRCLATGTRANPQRRFGDDVLSRISFSLDHPDGSARLQRCLVDEGIRPLVGEVLDAAGVPASAIRSVIMAGNPTMLQSLTGDSLDGLARFPFRLVWEGGRILPASVIGWDFPADSVLLPALGPFVGADIVAGALASGMLDDPDPTLLMDFGTNGEMLLLREGQAFATAVAAGPAFEGGRLRCGTAARADAVSALELVGMVWRCLGGDGRSVRSASGISGAAYIDFLALAVDVGLLNDFGRFDRTHPLWETSGEMDDGDAILVLDGRLVISEADIAELLQAKAAFGAGLQVLLEEAGLAATDLARVLIAGGFGYHLRPAHARRIGLLPNLPVDRFEVIGNASLGGASLALHYDLSARIERLRTACRVIELNQIPGFSDHYADALLL